MRNSVRNKSSERSDGGRQAKERRKMRNVVVSPKRLGTEGQIAFPVEWKNFKWGKLSITANEQNTQSPFLQHTVPALAPKVITHVKFVTWKYFQHKSYVNGCKHNALLHGETQKLSQRTGGVMVCQTFTTWRWKGKRKMSIKWKKLPSFFLKNTRHT